MKSWWQQISDEDLMFVKRFVLASGSLKEIAKQYDVSYPTVRQRLNRLIEKIQIADSSTITSEFERQIRTIYADGKIELEAMKQLLELHRLEMGEADDHAD